VLVVRSYKAGLPGVRAANPDVRLSLGHDPAFGAEPVLWVEYPKPTGDPAARDVWCDAETRDWSARRAISFRTKPERAIKLSVSFFDRNRVVYTAWLELRGGVAQPASIAFDEMRPNPYFQPPDARVGAPIDVSQVEGIAFAPHDPAAGRLALSPFVLIE
jgi:hypothetical protein